MKYLLTAAVVLAFATPASAFYDGFCSASKESMKTAASLRDKEVPIKELLDIVNESFTDKRIARYYEENIRHIYSAPSVPPDEVQEIFMNACLETVEK
jgi:hypothetical protein